MLALAKFVVCGACLTLGMSSVRQSSTGANDGVSAKSPIRQTTFRKNLELDEGWRRTEEGWVQTADWTVSSSGTDQAHATRLHPSLIAVFVLLMSAGALLTFEPLIRKQKAKSDQVLIQKWARRMRHRAAVNRKDCL